MLVQIALQSILAEAVLKVGLLLMKNSFQTSWCIGLVLFSLVIWISGILNNVPLLCQVRALGTASEKVHPPAN